MILAEPKGAGGMAFCEEDEPAPVAGAVEDEASEVDFCEVDFCEEDFCGEADEAVFKTDCEDAAITFELSAAEYGGCMPEDGAVAPELMPESDEVFMDELSADCPDPESAAQPVI